MVSSLRFALLLMSRFWLIALAIVTLPLFGIHSHAETASSALASPSIEDSIRGWRRLSGNEFGQGSAR